MSGRMSLILVLAYMLVGVMAITVMPVAYADENITLNQEYMRAGSTIKVHLMEVKITDTPWSNIYPSAAPGVTKWTKLVYTYENYGDKPQKGYLNISFIDADGNEYSVWDYTGDTVMPHSTSEVRFIEVPVPYDAKIVKLKIHQTFDDTYYDIPRAIATAEPTSTPVPTPKASDVGCLPYIPMAMAGGIAALGMVINRHRIRR